MTVTSAHFATTPFGQIHFREAGSGPVLLLLHSNGHSGRQFEPLMRLLSDRFRVIAWDQPGHGDSDPVTRHLSVADFAGAVIGFLDAMGLDQVSVLGNSIGGAIAAELGGTHPDRIDRLFICECPLRDPADWETAWPQVERNHAVVMQSEADIVARVAGADDWMRSWWNVERSKAGGWAMLSVMWALRRHDMRACFAACKLPAVMIYGADSQLAKRAEAATALVPGAVLEMLPGCGHLPMLDDPALLARTILKHMA